MRTISYAAFAGVAVYGAGAPVTSYAQDTDAPPALEDLIPDTALDNPDDWAVDNGDESQPTPAQADEQSDTNDATEQSPVLIDPQSIIVPEPIEPNPDLPDYNTIAAPGFARLPDMEEFRISDQVTLAFPKDNNRFPEKTNFLERFRALSAIETLDNGDDSLARIAARARADEDLLRQMVRAYGYYDAQIIRLLVGVRAMEDPSAVQDDPRARFEILPGPRYKFGELAFGDLDAAPDADSLRKAFKIVSGDPIYADRIVAQQSALDEALGEQGYPFAIINEPELLIDHERREGDLTLPVMPKGKYQFGKVVSSDPDFLSGKHLARIARFAPGDTYKRSLEFDLRRAVIATGLASSVSVTPREVAPPKGGEPGEVAMDVSIQRAPMRTIAGAIGYGTEDGLKVEASWEHRNLLPPEGALKVSAIVGTREQLAGVSFKRNNFIDRDQVLTIDAYASDIDTDAVAARTVALRGSFERLSNLLFQKEMSWAAGAEVLWTDERNAAVDGVVSPREQYLIGGLFGRATIDTSDDLLDPSTGYRLTARIAPDISRSNDATSFYVRGEASATYYQPFGPMVLAGRAKAATIQGAQINDIAPSRRLYSGGGGSVRGYGFQAIGPRDAVTQEPVGGRSLAEFSIEARIETGLFDGALEVVPFFDAGSVSTSTTPDFDEIRAGAGIGIRYKTNFGPIRVDVGAPLNPTEFDAPIAVYVSLGQAF